ncbi:hypothetical protein [Pseudactinotalea sp. HY158]|uniref:hypothetical protein n=1 Tax=Pseudactinotalea sp. HY158 TaxID=2654547 RepID=UPI00129C567A|nr:hypothetical protein [Pseudactinotalea sp. HY158]QGH68224.1 hypothetical protein GCE65_00840 [Pseudactinotalea sp. HY158]
MAAVPTAASADSPIQPLASSTRQCTNMGQIFGSNNSTSAVTSSNNCGQIGVRVHYVHPGGSTWKPWKYQSSGTVEQFATNITQSQHFGANYGTFTLNR